MDKGKPCDEVVEPNHQMTFVEEWYFAQIEECVVIDLTLETDEDKIEVIDLTKESDTTEVIDLTKEDEEMELSVNK